MKAPRPRDDEVTAVDPYFVIPGFPEPSVESKRWALQCLDRIIASTEFRVDGFAFEDDDIQPMRKWKTKSRIHWRKRLATYRWLHKIIGMMTCKGHRDIEVTD